MTIVKFHKKIIIISLLLVTGLFEQADAENKLQIKKTIYLQKHLNLLNIQDYALSPNGEYLAAVMKKPKVLTIYAVKNFSKKTFPLPEKLSGKVKIRYLAWSPDSKQIAFTEHFFRYFFEPDIWLFDVARGSFKNITDDGVNGNRVDKVLKKTNNIDCCPFWDDKSKGVYFVRTIRQPGKKISEPSLCYCIPGEKVQVIIKLKNFQPFCIYRKPALSEDGTKLAIMYQGDKPDDINNGVWIVDLKKKTIIKTIPLKSMLKAAATATTECRFLMQDVCWMNNNKSLLVTLVNKSYAASIFSLSCMVQLKTNTIIVLDNSRINRGLQQADNNTKRDLVKVLGPTLIANNSLLLFYFSYADIDIFMITLPAKKLKKFSAVKLGKLEDIMRYPAGYIPLSTKLNSNGMALVEMFNCIIQLEKKTVK